MKEIKNKEGLVFKITKQGIHFGSNLLPINQIYEYLELYTYINMFANGDSIMIKDISNIINSEKTNIDIPILFIKVGNDNYIVPILKEDIVNKKAITIYTVKHNIGNIIGKNGDNIKIMFDYIQENIENCKLTRITVKELAHE